MPDKLNLLTSRSVAFLRLNLGYSPELTQKAVDLQRMMLKLAPMVWSSSFGM
jgi:hypothetical protein